MKNISSRSYDSKGLDTRANILTAGIVGRQSAGTCASAVQTFCKCTISLMGYLILSVFYRFVTRYPLNPSPLAPQIQLLYCAHLQIIFTYLHNIINQGRLTFWITCHRPNDLIQLTITSPRTSSALLNSRLLVFLSPFFCNGAFGDIRDAFRCSQMSFLSLTPH